MTLCINCMQGSIIHGVCNRCHKPDPSPKDRISYALPARMTLCQQYYIGCVLGAGGYGITYLAWDLRGNRRVAVKELYPRENVSRGQDGLRVIPKSGSEGYFSHVKGSFKREAQILYELSDVPDVMDVYHLFEEYGTAYYVMEYLEGEDLSRRLKRDGPMSWEELRPHLWMVLRALDALHTKGLIHRDISPDNIFLLKDGNTKLIDFGSVRNYEDGSEMSTILKHRFAPYEQYQSRGNQGPWTDIYALSVTIYYALTGKLPQRASDRMLEDKTIPLTQIAPTVPAPVAAAIAKGMSPKIEDRYPSIREFAADLLPGEKLFGQAAQPHPQNHSQNPFQNHPQNQPPHPQPGGQPKARAAAPASGRPAQNPEQVGWLVGLQGVQKGRRLRLAPGAEFSIGRAKECTLSYAGFAPKQIPGVSRRQCSVTMDNRGLIDVRDDGSSYDTKINGVLIPKGKWTPVRRGAVLLFGYEAFRIQ